MKQASFVNDFLIKAVLNSHLKFIKNENLDATIVDKGKDSNGYIQSFKEPALQLLWNEWQAAATAVLTVIDCYLE
jgi:hypothetical protein